MAYSNSLRSIHILNDGYRYALTNESKRCEQPADIKVPLRPHQMAVLYEMRQRELDLNVGLDSSGAKLFSSFAIMGDNVGVGKSLMILGHVSNLKRQDPIQSRSKLTDFSSGCLYSVESYQYGIDVSNAGCLIVVPHTLYKQWETYIKEQTTLTYYGVKTKNYIEKPMWTKGKMLEKDIVLVSNTIYGKLQSSISREGIEWKRVFFDEADSIAIPSTQEIPSARFTWLISASWSNLLLPNTTVYYSQNHFNTYLQDSNDHLDPQLLNIVRSWRHRDYGTGNFYVQQHHHLVSFPFMRYYIGSANKYRGRLVVRCRDSFIEESVSLPPLYIQNILCKPSAVHHVIANAITAEVRQLLHAGDYTGALEQLGVKGHDSLTLIQAVTENRNKELERLEKTYEFKASIEYSTEQAKELALKHLKAKIDGLRDQIKTLKERIENYKNETCPICFDEPQSAVLTHCCHRVFCAGCILTSLTRMASCPLCRSALRASDLRSLTLTPTQQKQEAPTNEPIKKIDQLLKTIRQTIAENPKARFLIFSRFDNPLTQIGTELHQEQIRAVQVHGNKDVINNTLKQFEKGEIRVLLLNSIMAGAGMNITSATHVLLLHAMNNEEEKQIIGRAYRAGRKDPLQIIRLLHPDEFSDLHQTPAS